MYHKVLSGEVFYQWIWQLSQQQQQVKVPPAVMDLMRAPPEETARDSPGEPELFSVPPPAPPRPADVFTTPKLRAVTPESAGTAASSGLFSKTAAKS